MRGALSTLKIFVIFKSTGIMMNSHDFGSSLQEISTYLEILEGAFRGRSILLDN